jgi:hypothetical protein
LGGQLEEKQDRRIGIRRSIKQYFIAALILCLIAPGGANADELKPETIAAFNRKGARRLVTLGTFPIRLGTTFGRPLKYDSQPLLCWTSPDLGIS